jgi:hypothetical protein
LRKQEKLAAQGTPLADDNKPLRLDTFLLQVWASDNVALLIYVFSQLNRDISSEFPPLLYEASCKEGSLEVIRFIRLVDPHNRLRPLNDYLRVACKNRHYPVIRLIAPLAGPKQLTDLFREACSMPKSTPKSILAICLIQQGQGYDSKAWLKIAIAACSFDQDDQVSALSAQAGYIKVLACLLALHPVPVTTQAIHVGASGWYEMVDTGLRRPLWDDAPNNSAEATQAEEQNCLLDVLSVISLTEFFKALSQYQGHLAPALMSCLVMRAMVSGKVENLNILFQQPDMNINELTAVHDSPLILACEANIHEAVLAAVIDLDARFNLLAVKKAVETGQVTHLRRLLAMPGALEALKMENFNVFYHHPFYLACRLGRFDIVEAFLEKIDVFSHLTEEQYVFLHACTISGFKGTKDSKKREADYLKICDLLFTKCKFFNPAEKFILLAIECGFTSLVRRFLTLGAAPHIPYGDKACTPLQAALTHKEYVCLVALLNDPRYVALGCPNLPAAREVYRHILSHQNAPVYKPENDPDMVLYCEHVAPHYPTEALHPEVIQQIYLQHPGYYYAISQDTQVLREIETLIMQTTLGVQGKKWDLGVYSRDKIVVDGKEYPAPQGMCEIMTQINTFKNLAYPACVQNLPATMRSIDTIAQTHAAEKTGVIGVFGKRHGTTREAYQEIMSMIARLDKLEVHARVSVPGTHK